jgi:hypothetical protein
LVRAAIPCAYRGAGRSMAGNPGLRTRPGRRADRIRQDARRLPRRDRQPRAARARWTARGRDADRLCLAPQSAVHRHREKPGGSACRYSRGLARAVCPTSKSAPWCERAIRRRANATRCAAGRRISSSPRRNRFTLLTSESGRAMLATTRTVIVDEIHALAPNKRGAHLSRQAHASPLGRPAAQWSDRGGALGILSLCSRAASAHAQASIRSSRPIPVPHRQSNQVSIRSNPCGFNSAMRRVRPASVLLFSTTRPLLRRQKLARDAFPGGVIAAADCLIDLLELVTNAPRGEG